MLSLNYWRSPAVVQLFTGLGCSNVGILWKLGGGGPPTSRAASAIHPKAIYCSSLLISIYHFVHTRNNDYTNSIVAPCCTYEFATAFSPETTQLLKGLGDSPESLALKSEILRAANELKRGAFSEHCNHCGVISNHVFFQRFFHLVECRQRSQFWCWTFPLNCLGRPGLNPSHERRVQPCSCFDVRLGGNNYRWYKIWIGHQARSASPLAEGLPGITYPTELVEVYIFEHQPTWFQHTLSVLQKSTTNNGW